MARTRDQIAESIIKYAERSKLHIHPGQDPYQWADLVIKKGGCPCVPSRPSCPCAFVKEDIKEFGRCRCGLFADGNYQENYNSLKSKAKSKKKDQAAAPVFAQLPAMNGKAKGELLKKISVNGFSIEDNGSRLTLRPRGADATSEVTIEDDGVNGFRVVSASGRYAEFARGQKRSYFESYINRWVMESVFQSEG
ncbi:MAG TPA: ferredoxin-thioredoxin reductase catalytic domain-containing protein [Dehalococcoidales bacterium]|nr:ferredoxin-thioredoxin reductase catalytic domain-containing protein [Dehalococcoidales bacterium]